MNKKAVQTIVFGVVIGLLIAVVLSLILLDLPKKFFLSNENKEENINYFYFSLLINDLIKMSVGDEKSSSFLMDEDSILIGFNDDINLISTADSGNSCLPIKLSKDIEKPVKCRGKQCLCFCKVNGDVINCEVQEARCEEIPLKVNPIGTCKHFVLYDKNEKLLELKLKKDESAFSIDPGLLKTPTLKTPTEALDKDCKFCKPGIRPTDCKRIDSSYFILKSDGNSACYGGLNNCCLPKDTIDKLNKFSSCLSQQRIKYTMWRVTEAYPPTISHISACHSNGRCVDIAFNPGNLDCSNVEKAIKCAKESGFSNILNEYENCGGKIYGTTTEGNIHIEY